MKYVKTMLEIVNKFLKEEDRSILVPIALCYYATAPNRREGRCGWGEGAGTIVPS